MDTLTPSKTDNELIAEFMGKPMSLQRYDTSGERSDHRIDYSAYETSWDELMPVVEKIDSIDIMHTSHIGKGFCSITVFNGGDSRPVNKYCQTSKGDNKIQSVYLAVVEFIKWYNEHKL